MKAKAFKKRNMGATSEQSPNSSESEKYIGPRRMINRLEYIRLLEQALMQLGYGDLARALETASGVEMHPRHATAFRDAVLGGDFQAALELLPELGSSRDDVYRARFLLLRTKYVEAISAGDTAAALHCLRHELQPLWETDKFDGLDGLQRLTAMLLSASTPDKTGENGSGSGQLAAQAGGREALLAELQALLPPSLLIPESRLEELVEQALLSQLEKCYYHNSRTTDISLFADYSAGIEQLPTSSIQGITAHTDEVWVVQFSSDGEWMATASKDGRVLLWQVDPVADHHVQLQSIVLRDSAPVTIVAFSPDSKWLLVSSSDGRLQAFRVGNVRQSVDIRQRGSETISAAAWLPDSRRVLITAGGRELQLIDVEEPGAVADRWELGQHTYDAVVSRDGSTCVMVGQDRRLRFLRLSDRREVFRGPEPAAVTCLSMSPDGRFLATNLANGVVHLWPLGDLAAPDTALGEPQRQDPMDGIPASPLQEYRAGEGSPGRFVIRSTFGGANAAFIASGSETGKVHIWHRESGRLLTSLKGHAGTVNSVAWNPRNQYLMASASDDHTVRIWQARAASKDH